MNTAKVTKYHLLVDEEKSAACRKAAVLEVRSGAVRALVAARYGISRQTLHTWLSRADEKGNVTLKPPGLGCRLSPAHKERLAVLIDAGPRACGFTFDAWTLPRVRDLIEREFAITYAWGHVGQILRSIGYSPQKPEKRARERDEEKIEEWKRTVLPRLEKKGG
jgi:transposase